MPLGPTKMELLPRRWTTVNRTILRPVTAITIFLPMDVLRNSINSLPLCGDVMLIEMKRQKTMVWRSGETPRPGSTATASHCASFLVGVGVLLCSQTFGILNVVIGNCKAFCIQHTPLSSHFYENILITISSYLILSNQP